MQIDGKIFPYKRQILKIFETAGRVLNENFENVVVSVNFVDEKEIKELNKNFRQIDKITDVLSFPNLQKSPSQKLAEFDNEVDDEGKLLVGDIVICKRVAYAQAKEYGHSKKREVCFLALHGLLHLLGYDHIEKEDEKIMSSTAEKILSTCGVHR
ncbi:MAG: rRNA maturation RNase YbeY [Candidatus Caccovivens sp.]